MTESGQPAAPGTRGEILGVLCRGRRTISELAEELGLSRNTVRTHLDRLESEGLIRFEVVRRGVGRPAHVYDLTAEGSLRLSRAYLPLFVHLLSTLAHDDGSADLEATLRAAGRRLARGVPRTAGPLSTQADSLLQLLSGLGAVGAVRERDGALWIEGSCCPLRALVAEQPLVCKAVEALAEEFTGLPVREACRKHDPPSCRLLVGAVDEDM